MDINGFVKEFNNRTTLRLTRGENNAIIKQDISKEDIVSLYDIYEYFFDMYSIFKNKLNGLGKVNVLLEIDSTSDNFISQIHALQNTDLHDFIQNNYDFLLIYHFLKKRFLFGDLFATIFTSIRGSSLNKLDKMTFQFGMSAGEIEDVFVIELSLRDKNIVKVKKALIDSKVITISAEDAISLLKNSFVNKKFLPSNNVVKARRR